MAKAKKLPSGQWRTLVYDCTDPTGKRHYESFTADTKKESEYLAAEFALTKKIAEKPKDWTLRDAFDRYIENSDSTLSITTINRYKSIRNNSFQKLMKVKISSITNEILQVELNNELKRNVKNKKYTISPNTVRNDYSLVLTVLKRYAPRQEYDIRKPQKEVKIKELVSPDLLLNALYETDVELPALISMWLSFSMSELKGLKWSSIHENTIQIDQVVVRVNKEDVEKINAKNEKRKRVHIIPEYIMELLNNTEKNSEYIITASGSAIYKRFQRILLDNGLPKMTFHDLRHVNASVMHMLNIPDKYAQERGGWKTDHIMKTVYTHTFSPERIAVDNKVDDYFSGIINENATRNATRNKKSTDKSVLLQSE